MISIIIFYNKALKYSYYFSRDKRFLHCNLITFDGSEWLYYEFNDCGLNVSILNKTSIDVQIEKLKRISYVSGFIVIETKERAKIKWSPFIIRSCNEFIRLIIALPISFTLNPKHLFKKIIKLSNKNPLIIYKWNR